MNTENELKNFIQEQNMETTGKEKYLYEVNQAKIKNDLSRIDVVSYISNNYIVEFAQFIVDWADKVITTGQGQRATVFLLLKDLKENEDTVKKYNKKLLDIKSEQLDGIDFIRIADATVGSIFDCCLTKTKKTKIQFEIANAINDEMRWDFFKEQAPYLVKSKMEDYRYSTYKYIRTSLKSYVKKIAINNDDKSHLLFDEMSNHNKVKVGQLLLELFIENLGLVEVKNERLKNKKQVSYVYPTPELEEYLNELFNQRACSLIKFKPITVKPKPWINCFEGGYHNIDNVTYVRGSKKLNEKINEHDISFSMQQTNRIQDVPYRINKKVHEVVMNLYQNSQDNIYKDGEMILPTINEQLPSRSFILTQDYNELNEEKKEEYIEAVKKYKELKKQFHFEKVSNGSKLNEFRSQLQIANELLNEPEIYYPSNKCSRGRTYPIATTLNYQSNDIGRGLIESANGDKIKEEGVYWLAVSGAGLYDQDKETMDDRFNWVLDNEEMILNIAADPYSSTEWWKADKPVKFLGFCFEWAGWKDKGYDHITHMWCGRDGSCNGLQWFAGILLDEVSGNLVNLTNNESFQDIYGKVAEEVNKYIDEQEWNEDDLKLVKIWKEWGIDRSMCKRPTMTLSYNSKFHGWVEQIRKEIKDTIAKGKKKDVFGEFKFNQAPRFLAKILEIVMPKVVVAAFKAMKYMESTIETFIKGNPDKEYIHWMTPTGFPVYQRYQKKKEIRVETKLGSKRIVTKLKADLKDININKHKNATPPNFIHSCDASHLDMTVDKCYANGITDFSFVHDEFSVRANDVGKLDKIIRETFVEINQVNLLEKFIEQLQEQSDVDLPNAIARGDLDLNEVLVSQFFFC